MNTSKENAKNAASKKSDLPADFETPEDFTPEEAEQLKAPLPAPVSKEGLSVDKLSDDEFIDKIFEQMETAGESRELTSNYIKFDDFKEGEKRSYIATGLTTFTTQDGEVKPAVRLIDRERTNFICASTVVVNTVKGMDSLPAPVIIQVNGKKKGANGSYFDVRIFTI